MSSNSKCPQSGTIDEFARGELPHEQRERLAEHIQGCWRCQKQLRELDSSVEETDVPSSRQDFTQGLDGGEAEGLDENLIGLLAPAQVPTRSADWEAIAS